MRKLILHMSTTADGFIAKPDGRLWGRLPPAALEPLVTGAALLRWNHCLAVYAQHGRR
jgi:hypothetical protein